MKYIVLFLILTVSITLSSCFEQKTEISQSGSIDQTQVQSGATFTNTWETEEDFLPSEEDMNADSEINGVEQNTQWSTSTSETNSQTQTEINASWSTKSDEEIVQEAEANLEELFQNMFPDEQ